MKILMSVLLSIFILGVQQVGAEMKQLAKTKIKNPDGEVIGLASFVETSQGINIAVQVRELTPGLHGIHIHENGSCEKPDFKSAGGHFNPYNMSHGTKNPKGYHVGDLGNISVAADGTGSLFVTSSLATLQAGKNSLFDEDGSAIVIHSGPDDLISDPSGNAGSRVGCGEIKLVK